MEREKEVNFFSVRDLIEKFVGILKAMSIAFPEIDFCEEKGQLATAKEILDDEIHGCEMDYVGKAKWLAHEATNDANRKIIGFTRKHIIKNEIFLNGKHGDYIKKLDTLEENFEKKLIKPQSVGGTCKDIITEINERVCIKKNALEEKNKELEKNLSKLQDTLDWLEKEFHECPTQSRYSLFANLDTLRESIKSYKDNPKGVGKLITTFKEYFEMNREYYRG